MMKDYFEAQMRSLQEAAQDFAKQYPEQARMLHLTDFKGRDPNVERLLEGFAFLTARLQQQLDQSQNSISESLLQQLCPQLLRPYPSHTILQFQTQGQSAAKNFTIPAGTLCQSEAVGNENTIIYFQTLTDTLIQPLAITDIQIQQHKTHGQEIKLTFKNKSNNPINLASLRFYIHADLPAALQFYQACIAECLNVDLSFPENPTQHPQKLTGFSPVILHEWPAELQSFKDGYADFSLLVDFFCYREKFLFIDLNGFEKITWPENFSTSTITIHTKTQLDFKFKPEHLRLNCVPAINLFKTASEPIHRSTRHYQYPLVINQQAPESQIFYAIENVTGATSDGENHNYSSLSENIITSDHGYQIIASTNKNLSTHFIQFAGEQELTETISCDVMACNGQYPYQFLTENSIKKICDRNLGFIEVGNLTRPTPMFSPPQQDTQFLLSFLNLQYQSFENIEHLKQLFAYLNWQHEVENQNKIAALQKINFKPFHQVIRGALTQGISIELQLKENAFINQGEIYLFGTLLQHFFSHFVAINHSVSLKIICQSSQKEFLWKPQIGKNLNL